ncbi:MAG: arsenate reductase family protein [Oligoflexales bacterium]|nr:arsenate reductase family protein [Oligoflexales bacterium]
MKKIKFYGYNKCSTCVKAKKFLDKHSVTYEDLDITTTAPSAAELKQMLAEYHGDIKKLFNTSGQAYREMNLKDEIADMTPAKAITMLSKNGRLVKRPFLIGDTSGLVGFKEDEWKTII